jgi:O-antigen/teichoic acid export membrane protein
MSVVTENPLKLKIARWIEYFNIPLHRNSFALVFSFISTSVLGIAYWSIAARNFSTEEVGINSAVLSAMMFLGYISQFGLVNFLNRFLPKAGRATSKFIGFSYLFSILLGLISSTLFILGIDYWSPTLGFLKSDPNLFVWFVVATVLWCIFALQDGALVGLRRATWVPVENIIFSTIKLVLLLAFSGTIIQLGIFASWTFPLIFMIIVINALIFSRVIPQHINETGKDAEKFNLPQIIRFIVGDYFGTLMWSITITLMPIIVLELMGASANAYFYLPWKIAAILFNVSRSMGISLTVEAAKDQSKIEEFINRSIIQSIIVLVPVVLIILIASPVILRIYGEGYATEGSNLLRLLALSALPFIVTTLFVSVARVQRQIKDIVFTMMALGGLVLSLTFLSIDRLGLIGIGWAWLISQLVVATVIGLTKFREILITKPIKRIVASISNLIQSRRFVNNERKLSAVIQNVGPDILPLLSKQSTGPSEDKLTIDRVFNTLNDVAVASLGANGSSPELIMYLSNSKLADERLNSQQRILTSLYSDERLKEWGNLLPKLKEQGRDGNVQFWVYGYVPGIRADEVMSTHPFQDKILRIAGEAILDLHRITVKYEKVNSLIMKTWISDPIEIIRNSMLPYFCYGSREILDRLVNHLERSLLGRELAMSWIHGDYWPQNIIITPDVSRVTGIVDWEQAKPCDLPYLDLANLFLSTRRLSSQREIGETIVEVLHQNSWGYVEHQIWDWEEKTLGGDLPSVRDVILIFWLRHLSANLKKSKRYQMNPVWALSNFVPVIEALKKLDDQ